MRIEPVGVAPPYLYIPEIESSREKLKAVDITPILPKSDKPSTLWDIVSPAKSPFADLFNILSNIVTTKIALIQLNNTVSTDADSGADYERYLQFPNPRIQALSSTIVSPADSYDAKMYKIEQWVRNNIEYVSDFVQYSESELWAFPTMTIDSGQGDCEDGAFLMHSLALHANIPSERLRTYGGIVVTGDGIGVGGHAWTAYQREIDNEWIIADWCYLATDTPINERSPMSENLKYIDDYFFIQATKTVETPYTNRVRFAASSPPFFLNTIA
jgi:predicted transglutaminase-like cysteine proteinase